MFDWSYDAKFHIVEVWYDLFTGAQAYSRRLFLNVSLSRSVIQYKRGVNTFVVSHYFLLSYFVACFKWFFWMMDQRWVKEEKQIDISPLEGAVCSGFIVSSPASLCMPSKSKHIQGHGSKLSLPSYIDLFEQNPTPTLLQFLINRHI